MKNRLTLIYSMRYPNAKINPNTPDNCNKALKENHVRSLNYGDWERYEKLLKYYSGGRLLDAGCLNSPIGVEMKKKYPNSEIIALDHGQKLVDYFKALYPEVNYICSDIYKLPFEKESFDYVVAGEVLEHLDHPNQFIKEVCRVLKKGGTFAISTPLEEWNKEQGGEWHVNMFTFDELKMMFTKFVDVKLDTYKCGAAVDFALVWGKK